MKRSSMAEALSNAAGHNYSRNVARPGATAAVLDAPQPAPSAMVRVSTSAPSRVGKKPVTGFFEPAVSRQLKRIGLDQEKTMQDLIQEALNDLFRKYDLPPIA